MFNQNNINRMKKKHLFFALAISLILGACTKEGDFEELDNVGVSMDDISFGLPLGSSSINAGELLGKWQHTECEITFENDLLVINYNDSYTESINFANSSSPKAAKGSKIPDFVNTISGDLSIDLFKNFPEIDNENFKIEGIYANLDILLKAYVKTNDTPLKKYITNAYFNNLKISVVSEDGTISPLYTQNDNQKISVAELQKGINIPILDSSKSVADDKIAQLFINRPKRLHYELQMHLEITDDNISASDLQSIQNGNYNHYFRNTIQLDSMIYTTTIGAHFPLRIACKNIVYQDTIDFPIEKIKEALSTTSNKVALSSSFYLAVRFINTLPLSFTISDMLIDINNNPVSLNGKPVHIFKPNHVVQAPNIIPETLHNKLVYHTDGQTESHMLVQINKHDVDQLATGDKLVLTITLNTPEYNKAVSVLEYNKLSTSLYLLSNPSDEFMKNRFQ